MRARFGELPVIGVIEPGAAAAVRASPSGRIAVLATEGTIRGGAYTRAIGALRADAQVTGVPCALFVALAEEGWVDGPVAEAAAERYLAPLGQAGASAAGALPDTLVLGCTHFPVLEPVIVRAMARAMGQASGPGVRIVDSAATTAAAVQAQLAARGLLAPAGSPVTLGFLATDGAGRFAAVGARFLGEAISADDVELIDL
jgi:glutamate racemase